MKADTLDLRQIFGKDVRYLVPLFQRNNVWGQKDRWVPLGSDIRDVAEYVLLRGDKDDSPPHFLGPIVVDQQQHGTRTVNSA